MGLKQEKEIRFWANWKAEVFMHGPNWVFYMTCESRAIAGGRRQEAWDGTVDNLKKLTGLREQTSYQANFKRINNKNW